MVHSKRVHLLLLVALLLKESHCFLNNVLDTFIPNLGDDGYLDTATLAKRYGYRCEEHFVTTSDGYILKMHRLNGKIKGPILPSTAPIVFILHGTISADTSFILDGPNSHGGILSDYGFDVWMGNHRGNRYSKNHTSVKTDSKEFWNFNYNEMSQIDIPTFLDYILKHVNKKSLHVIGNSQGGAMISMLLAYKPEYNAKVKSFTFLASALYPGKLESSFFQSIMTFLDSFSTNENVYTNPKEIVTYSNSTVRLLNRLCNKNSMFFVMCQDVINNMFGKEKNNLNLDRYPFYVIHGINGASSNQLLHTTQFYTKNRIQLYDYGLYKNLQKYGRPTPPIANFSLVTPPKLFFYGTEDTAVPKEVVLASPSLTINVEKVVCVDSYNHVDFLYAYSLKEKVTDVIKDFMLSHKKS